MIQVYPTSIEKNLFGIHLAGSFKLFNILLEKKRIQIYTF